MKKKIRISLLGAAISGSLTQAYAVPCTNGIYDMRPKNYFRGGSVGKGGKIKYKRT